MTVQYTGFIKNMKIGFHHLKFQPPQEEVPTLDFLACCTEYVKIFDIMGNIAFKPIKMDLNGNILKLQKKYDSCPEKYQTLQKIVQDELDKKVHDARDSATDALLWLNRGLRFASVGLRRNVDHPGEELSVSFTNAYGEVLKPHHNFFIKPIFSMAIRAVPNREEFYQSLGDGIESSEATLAGLLTWLTGLEKSVDIITTFYKSSGLSP